MNRKASLVLIGLVLITSAGMTQAGSELPPDSKNIIQLHPTELGEKFGAFGASGKMTKNDIERFITKVSARAKDGTLLMVRGYHRDGTVFDVGAIEIMLGLGSLELNSSIDPSEVFPLNNLLTITIDHREGTILKGDFER